ncbi:fibrobacter succinogenes major paralogous domain-containing protein [Bacteroidota bacterium]
MKLIILKILYLSSIHLICLAGCGSNNPSGYDDQNNNNNNQTETVTDIDGNVYQTVSIGNQIWMTENLKSTRLNDGTPIENVPGSYQWTNLVTPAYCWLNNDETNKDTYGAFYNYYTVSTGLLAPAGWHVPSEDEFRTLLDYLGGESLAGERLYEIGFRAQGAGQLASEPGEFNLFPDLDKYWTTTTGGWEPTDIKYFILTRTDPEVHWSSHPKSAGHSVRCIRD